MEFSHAVDFAGSGVRRTVDDRTRHDGFSSSENLLPADAELAGVPDDDLVTGSREALEKLRRRLVFTKGSFKTREAATKADAVDPHV